MKHRPPFPFPHPGAPRCRQPFRGRKHGFTLVELLVVIGIIVVLAAILVAVTTKVRQSARTAQATSNIRQIGTLLGSYTQENNSCLPILRTNPDHTLGSNPDNFQFWQNYLRIHAGLPYTGNPRTDCWLPAMFYDPTVKKGRQHLWGCFGGNDAIFLHDTACAWAFGHTRGTPVSRIGPPERKVVVASASDVKGSRFDSSWYFSGGSWANQGESSGLPKPAARHGGKSLALFGDGHVETLDTVHMSREDRRRYFLPDGYGSGWW